MVCLDMPFSKNSRTASVMSINDSKGLKQSAAWNDFFQSTRTPEPIPVGSSLSLSQIMQSILSIAWVPGCKVNLWWDTETLSNLLWMHTWSISKGLGPPNYAKMILHFIACGAYVSVRVQMECTLVFLSLSSRYNACEIASFVGL